MTRQELAYHYESLLDQTIGIENHSGALGVLNEILDDALAVLKPWEDKIQRPVNEFEREQYRKVALEMTWTLRNPDEDIPPDIRQVAQLVMLCTNAIELGVIQRQSYTIRQIMNAYRSLDAAEANNVLRKNNDVRVNNFLKIKNDLESCWRENIDPTWTAPRAARKLEESSIYKASKTKPKRAMLERYVREWQLMQQITER